MKLKVYVAGPYTKGDVAINVSNAISAANELADLGYYPYVPHLTHFWHMLSPRLYEFWLELDLVYLECCNVLLRLPGESNGADGEVKKALELKIPVFYNIQEIQDYFNKKDAIPSSNCIVCGADRRAIPPLCDYTVILNICPKCGHDNTPKDSIYGN